MQKDSCMHVQHSVCRVPRSEGLGHVHKGMWDPFSLMSITGGNYASPPHLDKSDVGMSFIVWYLRYSHGNLFNICVTLPSAGRAAGVSIVMQHVLQAFLQLSSLSCNLLMYVENLYALLVACHP